MPASACGWYIHLGLNTNICEADDDNERRPILTIVYSLRAMPFGMKRRIPIRISWTNSIHSARFSTFQNDHISHRHTHTPSTLKCSEVLCAVECVGRMSVRWVDTEHYSFHSMLNGHWRTIDWIAGILSNPFEYIFFCSHRTIQGYTIH